MPSAERRFSLLLLTLFAGLALLLSAIGIYGVMAYSTTQRRHEIGIRMALGAGPRDVLEPGGGAGDAAGRLIGLAIGLTGAWTLSRVLTSQLYGVSARDPFTYVSVAPLLGAVALTASYLPARRAPRVDPMISLEVRMMDRPACRISATPSAGCGGGPGSPPSRCSRSRSASAPTRAIFSVVNGVLLRPLPYDRPDRARHDLGSLARAIPRRELSVPEYWDLREQNRSFSRLAAYADGSLTLTGAGEPERLRAGFMTRRALPLLGVAPARGRAFSRRRRPARRAGGVLLERRPLAAPVRRPTRRSSGARSCSTTHPATVIGVMPAGFQLPTHYAGPGAEIWAPLQLDPAIDRSERGWHWVNVLARLRPGVAISAASLRSGRARPPDAGDLPRRVQAGVRRLRGDRGRRSRGRRPARDPGAARAPWACCC